VSLIVAISAAVNLVIASLLTGAPRSYFGKDLNAPGVPHQRSDLRKTDPHLAFPVGTNLDLKDMAVPFVSFFCLVRVVSGY
jgi:hypothetical protein